jgi:predicted metal-dependent hydrolase
VAEQDVPLKFKNGYFLLLEQAVKDAPEFFKQFYKTKLQKKLSERLKLHQAKTKHLPSDVKVMELQNRWGSCTAKGVLNFHWKCAMLPMSVLDYVIVHELAHLEHPNHSPAFWRSVEKVMPNFEEPKNWLKFNGAGMSL